MGLTPERTTLVAPAPSGILDPRTGEEAKKAVETRSPVASGS